jgi:seryl-tRNA synthetase
LELKLKGVSELEKEAKAAKETASRLEGEINNQKKKSESQTQELMKVMKDSSQSLAEFERALIRKSEECNDLYHELETVKAQQGDGRGSAEVGSRASQAAAQLTSMVKRLSTAAIPSSGRDSDQMNE